MGIVSSQRAVFHAPESQTTSARKVGVPAGNGCGEPRIEVVRDGDVVCAIDVHCACGEQIRIVCNYETASS